MLSFLVTTAAVIAVALVVYVPYARQRRALISAIHEVRRHLDESGSHLLRVSENLRRDIELIRGGHSAEEAAELLGTSEAQLRKAEELMRRHESLSVELTERGFSYSRQELRTIKGVWQGLMRSTERFLPELRAVEGGLDSVIDAAARLPERLRAVQELIDEVAAAADTGRALGFDVQGDIGVVADAPERLNRIQEMVDERRLLAAEEPLVSLTGDLTAARDALRTLRERGTALKARLGELSQARKRLDDQRTEAQRAREILVTQFAPQITFDIADHLAEADAVLDEMGGHIGTLAGALGSNDVHGGERAADAADHAHDRAQRALSAHPARLDKVRELSRNLSRRKYAAVEQAGRINQHANEAQESRPLAPLALELRTQLERLDMTVERPDWLTLEARIADIVAVLDPLETASQEVDRAMRHTRENLRRARHKLQTAGDAHSPESGS